MYTNGLKDRFGRPLISQRDLTKHVDEYNLNVVEPHITDQTIHITNDEHESLQELISVSEKIPLVNQNNTFEEKTTFTDNVIVSNGNILLLKSANIKYLDDGEVTISSGASGFPIFDGIPTIVSNSAIYNVGVIDGDIDLSGMYFDGDETIVQSCEVWFTTDSQLYNITWPSNLFWIDYDDGNMPQLLPNMKYRIVLRREIDDIIASISHFYSVR